MYCVPKFCLILCVVPLIKAINLKIDGLINFDNGGQYQLRVFRSGPRDSDHENDNKVGRERDEEHLLTFEHRMRKEVAEHRKEVLQKDVENTDKHHKHQKEKDAENPDKHHKRQKEKDAEHSDKHHKRHKEKGSKNSVVHNTEHVEKHKSKASSNRERSSFDNKMATAAIYDEITIKTKKILRFISKERNFSEPQQSSVSDVWSHTASWAEKTEYGVNSSRNDSNINITQHLTELSSKILEMTINKTKESISNIFNKTLPTLSTTTQVTTVRTANIYTDPHIVKDDAKITEFTNHLYKQTLKVFDTVKQNTDQDHLKVQVEGLARNYEDKFKEFVRDTGIQKIKTRLGTQKVILNTIEMSDRILKRLMNFMVGDLDKKGVLRHNAASAHMFQRAIEMEQKLEYSLACKKFGVCRSQSGFSAFLTDILTTLLKCDDMKLKQSMDAFTEVVKNKNLNTVTKPHTADKLQNIIEKIEKQDIQTLRTIVLIFKNTLTNKNKPITVNNFSARQRIVNSTLALLEIIDLMDTNIPRNDANALEWADMRKSFEEFAAGKRHDILEIMTALVKHVKTNLKTLDEDSWRIISKNMDMILSEELYQQIVSE